MTTEALPLVEEYGDSAVMVTVASGDPGRRQRRIVELRDAVLRRRPPGVTDVVSGLESLLIEFDPLVSGPDHLRHAVELIAELPGAADARERRVFDLPVCFDEADAPDLAAVAAELGLSPDAVVEQLLAHDLTVVLLAAAMAPMMSGVTLPASVARQARPRTDVPPGSLMIAGSHAIIQPFPGPTGWRVVGRTPLTIVDIDRPEPVSFAPGDVLRLRPITAAEAAELRGAFLGPHSLGQHSPDAPRQDGSGSAGRPDRALT